MFIYPPNLPFQPMRSPRSITEDILEWQLNQDLVLKINRWSVVLNIVSAFLAIWLFWPNFIFIGIAFVGVDMLLCLASNLFFNILPYYKNKNLTVEQLKQHLDYLTSKYHACAAVYGRYANCTSRCKLLIDCTTEHLNRLLENQQVEEKQDALNSILDEKIGVLETYHQNFQHSNSPFLTNVIIVLGDLIALLKKKPMGIDLVPASLYIYLNELNKIIDRFSTFTPEQIDLYKWDVIKVASGIEKNIDELISRIHKMDTDDIEVSLQVLLSELNSTTEKETLANEE